MLAYEVGTDLTLFLSKWMIASSHTTTFTDTTYMKLYLHTGYASSVYVYTHTHIHTHTHTHCFDSIDLYVHFQYHYHTFKISIAYSIF